MDLSDLAVWDMDAEAATITWDARGTEILGLASAPDFRFDDWLARVHPEDREVLRTLAEDVLNDPATAELEVDLRYCRPDGAIRFLTKRSRILRNGDGQPRRVLGVFADETDRREAEQQAQRLLAQLQHRIKNMAAVTRSMAMRTRRNSPDLESFAAHFDGRLGTFARTHGILARTPRGEASLEEILREELRQAGVPDIEGWLLEGPSVMLRQQAAEQLALAIHELATNAVKFGSAIDPDGILAVTWSVEETPPPRLTSDWSETGPADIAPRGPDGFGIDMILRALPYQLGAETEIVFERNGLRCRISVPLDTDLR